MKRITSLLTILLFVSLSCYSQTTINYFLPKKIFKISVTFTEISKKRVSKSTSKACKAVIDCETFIVIKDPITIDEIISPDLSHPIEFLIPKLDRSGASFDYSFKWSENGIATSFNGSREPLAVSIISGAVGFVSNLLTAVVGGLEAKKPSVDDVEYEELVVERKIQVIELMQINDCKSEKNDLEIKLPETYSFATRAPKVVVSLAKISTLANDVKSGTGEIKIKSRVPAIYSIKAVVKGMLDLPDQTAIYPTLRY
jgi:hypothetical protein